MDERLQAFLWILGSFGGGGALGAGFGAIAGALYWRSGGASGTRFALRVMELFRRFGEHDFSPTTKGALVGAVDGFLFLSVLGTLFALVALRGGPEHLAVLAQIGGAAALLVAGALFFGILAYTLTHAGVKALAIVCPMGIGAGVVGLRFVGAPGLLFGSVLGLVAGNGLALLLFRLAPPETPATRDDEPTDDLG
jgi:hypothetical protein